MKLNKSPGLDGLPVKFYRIFWPKLGLFLLDVYKENFFEEKLSNSQCKAVITLIYKGSAQWFPVCTFSFVELF